MSITPKNRHESFLAAAASGDTSLTPKDREEILLQNIAEAVSQGGGGGSVTVDSALSGSSENPVQNKVINIALAGKANNPTKTTVSGATPSITAADNTIYTCGEVSTLTVTAAANIEFVVIFTSGSTATTLTMDQNVVMPDSFSVAQNTRYEISVSNGYAVVAKWTVSST